MGSREHPGRLIFEIDSPSKFETLALKIFQYQVSKNLVYREYLDHLSKKAGTVLSIGQIPFLPAAFFRSHTITTASAHELVFESSGTTGQIPSRHVVADKELYIESFTRCFELFYGPPTRYCILALLPSYLERKCSSLVFMADHLIRLSYHPLSGFFLDDYLELSRRLRLLEKERQPAILLGVSFALLDFASMFPVPLKHTFIIETGGMKGRRKEMTRGELHEKLKQAFSIEKIHSEYGMTELLSQAYSTGDGLFIAPPWMKILIRNPYDPFELFPAGITGAVNVIDLANIYSCSFIQTDDVGKVYPDGTFEILGRMDNAELRGCNLLLE